MIANTRILLVDDHDIVLNGLMELLQSFESNYELSTASSGEDALQQLRNSHLLPQIVISDLDMEAINGRELCQRISVEFPNIKVVILSMHNEKGVIKDLMEAGASAFLTKTCSRTELKAAISAMERGKKFYSTEALESLSQEDVIKPEVNMYLRQLSNRELEILKHSCNGLSSKEIGEQLNISHRTVETHRNNIIKKLEVNNLAGLIKLAVKSGLVD